MPLSVLHTMQRDLLDYQGTGLSVMEMSHRSAQFSDIAERAEGALRSLLDVPANYSVLFMQGGASAQFALTVQNLDTTGCVAFANTGYWSAKAIRVAEKLTTVQQVANIESVPCIKVPEASDWTPSSNASYLHVTDNETIDGVVLSELPDTDLPIVADMSSSLLSRPIDVGRYGLIYAGAQKNIGPAGITLVIVRNDLLERSNNKHSLPDSFNYTVMEKAGSMLNTPPTFAWYAAGLVFDWLLEQGGLPAIEAQNQRQAKAVYDVIDSSPMYINTVHADNRSIMNIPFQLQDAELQAEFLMGAEQAGLVGLKGHKSVGGCRASLYNAVTDSAVDQLLQYLHDFKK